MDKRRDLKGRPLLQGESQRPDGRYRYKYVDLSGETHDIYSWRLVQKDPVPKGKRFCEPLRVLEDKVRFDLADGIKPDGSGFTVYTLCKKYVESKVNVTKNTIANYNTVLNILEKDAFGKRKIDTVKEIDAQDFLRHLQKNGRGYSSICNVRGVLRPAFEMAVRNDFIRKNPFQGWEIQEAVIKDSVRREAITPDQQRKFLKFIKEDEHFSQYHDAIQLLFLTGLRISEFCGLTLKDIDMKKKTISVNHQLQRDRNGTLYIIKGTKTNAGIRVLPMTDTVYEILRTVISNRKEKEEPVVDGYKRFLFINHNARKEIRPYVGMDWEHIFKHILEKYNSIYKEELPLITPHVCRHTYATQMAKKVGIKTLQYLMGHASVELSLNLYTDYRLEDAIEDIEKAKEKAGENNGKSEQTWGNSEW